MSTVYTKVTCDDFGHRLRLPFKRKAAPRTTYSALKDVPEKVCQQSTVRATNKTGARQIIQSDLSQSNSHLHKTNISLSKRNTRSCSPIEPYDVLSKYQLKLGGALSPSEELPPPLPPRRQSSIQNICTTNPVGYKVAGLAPQHHSHKINSSLSERSVRSCSPIEPYEVLSNYQINPTKMLSFRGREAPPLPPRRQSNIQDMCMATPAEYEVACLTPKHRPCKKNTSFSQRKARSCSPPELCEALSNGQVRSTKVFAEGEAPLLPPRRQLSSQNIHQTTIPLSTKQKSKSDVQIKIIQKPINMSNKLSQKAWYVFMWGASPFTTIYSWVKQYFFWLWRW